MSIGFDIHGLDQNAREDQEGIQKASKLCKRMFWNGNDLEIMFDSERYCRRRNQKWDSSRSCGKEISFTKLRNLIFLFLDSRWFFHVSVRYLSDGPIRIRFFFRRGGAVALHAGIE